MIGSVILPPVSGGSGSGEDTEARADIAELRDRFDEISGFTAVHRPGRHYGYDPVDQYLSPAAAGFTSDPTLYVSWEGRIGDGEPQTVEGTVTVNVNVPLYKALWELEVDLYNLGIPRVQFGLFEQYVFVQLISSPEVSEPGTYSSASISFDGDALYEAFRLYYYVNMYASCHFSEVVHEHKIVLNAEEPTIYLENLENKFNIVIKSIEFLRNRVAALEAAAE